MESSQEALTQHLRSLIARIEAEGGYEEQGSLPELIVRLNKQFPDDVGIFCALLLNYVKLQPGEGIFLAANEPHAYLSGGRLSKTHRSITHVYSPMLVLLVFQTA